MHGVPQFELEGSKGVRGAVCSGLTGLRARVLVVLVAHVDPLRVAKHLAQRAVEPVGRGLFQLNSESLEARAAEVFVELRT